jgi:hypothetical protein
MTDPFSITKARSGVVLLSARRMPYDPKGDLALARRCLREAIQEIAALPGQIIEGVYSSRIEDRFDVENVAFYNIGTGPFRNSSKGGLRARRCRLHDEASTPGFPHKLEYRLIPTPAPPNSCVARLSFTPDKINSSSDVWWAASGVRPIDVGPVIGAYGIYVHLNVPNPPKNPAGKMKVLFDGIIAALQGDPSPDRVAVERLARKYRVDASEIEERLTKPFASAIMARGSQRVVRPTGANVHWYPADDQCEECTLIVAHSATPSCEVYIYALPSGADAG